MNHMKRVLQTAASIAANFSSQSCVWQRCIHHYPLAPSTNDTSDALVPESSPRVYAASVAHRVAHRSDGLVWFPEHIAIAIQDLAREHYGGRMDVRRMRVVADKIAAQMRLISRTKQHGGLIDPLILIPDSALARRQATESARRNFLADLEHRHLPTDTSSNLIIFDEAQVLSHRIEPKIMAELMPSMRYGTEEALVYAASRAPACYAAAIHVLHELKRRMPVGWVPRNMLDFASGPGSSIWAARDVFRDETETPVVPPPQILAVEPNPHMRSLAQSLYQASFPSADNATDTSDAPSSSTTTTTLPTPTSSSLPVRWVSRLPYYGSSPPPDRIRTHDLVMASYVLNEIPDPDEKRKVILDLWSRTRQILILIEPGTPIGFHNIATAREAILARTMHETRRVQKLLSLIEQARELGLLGTGDAMSSEVAAESNPLAHVLQRLATAPIPPAVDARRALAVKEALLHPRARQLLSSASNAGAHVLAPCPGDGVCPMLAHVTAALQTPDASSPAAPGSDMFCHFRQRFERPELMRLLKQSQTADGGKARGYQDERFSYVVLQRGARSRAASSQLVMDEWSSASSYATLEKRDEAPPEVLEQLLGKREEEEEASREEDESSMLALDALIDRVLDGEAPESVLLATDRRQEPAAAAFSEPAPLPPNPPLVPSTTTTLSSPPSTAAIRDSIVAALLPDGRLQLESRDWLEKHAGNMDQVAHEASMDWPRLVRPSLKQSGHVLLDACCPAPPLAPTSILHRPPPNELRRYILRRASRRWLGHLPYRFARRSVWGDLLPAPYTTHAAYWEVGRAWRRVAFHRPLSQSWRKASDAFVNLDSFFARASGEVGEASGFTKVMQRASRDAETRKNEVAKVEEVEEQTPRRRLAIRARRASPQRRIRSFSSPENL